jgi:hypothetical protein
MPAQSNLAGLPRQELALAVVEGEGAVKNAIGEKALGPLPISYRNAHYIKATLGGSLGLRHIGATKYVRAMGTRYERATATLTDGSLTVTPRGLEISVPREMSLDYKDKFDVLAFFSGRFGQEIGALTKEYLIAQVLFSSTAYALGSSTNSGVAYTAANRDKTDGTGMNPIQDIIASTRRVKAYGEQPDTVIMSGPVWERVSTCYQTLQFVRGIFGPIADVTPDIFLKSLNAYGIKQVLVGDNYINTAADGATASLTQVWSNTYMVVCKAGMSSASQTEGSLVPSLTGLGANVYWEGFDSAGNGTLSKVAESYDFQGGGGYYVEVYPSWETESDIIRVKMSHNPTITNNRAGDIIATQYS